MLRFLVALLMTFPVAASATVYVETVNGSVRDACVTGIDEQQKKALWTRLESSLAGMNYMRLSSIYRSPGEFSDGAHTLFAYEKKQEVCVRYKDPTQPEIPLMHGGEFFEPVTYCHAKGVPFTFTWEDGVVFSINRFGDEAYCIWRHGETFECEEQTVRDGAENHYFVTASIAQKGKVLVFTPPNEPMQMISRCDVFE